MLTSFKKCAAAMPADREVVFFVPFTLLAVSAELLRGCENIFLGGQDVYPAAEGAFTGEISPGMLKDSGCRFVMTGHSERRHILGESDEFVGRKTVFTLEAGLDTTLCVGETLEQREKGALNAVLTVQLEAGIKNAAARTARGRLSIAYEPVWAIGTGKVAGPAEILEAHALIRKLLRDMLGAEAEATRILYGGSVKTENAGEIMALDNVDGVLVGGASLQADVFSRIVLA
jgi:triosephosphate isomerase